MPPRVPPRRSAPRTICAAPKAPARPPPAPPTTSPQPPGGQASIAKPMPTPTAARGRPRRRDHAAREACDENARAPPRGRRRRRSSTTRPSRPAYPGRSVSAGASAQRYGGHVRPTPLLVFFTSRRSGPARRMESLLAHIARKERDTLRVKRVDVDERPDLAKRSGSPRCRRSCSSRASASSRASRAARPHRRSSRCSTRTCARRAV